MDVLPSSYPTVLVCWTPEEIDALCDPVLAKETRESKARIEQTYAVLRRLIDEIGQDGSRLGELLLADVTTFSLEVWYWAWLSVQVGVHLPACSQGICCTFYFPMLFNTDFHLAV